MTKPAIKYAAEVTHVREVSLLGTADLGYWEDRLEKENLVPDESNGKAQLLIIAAELKFMGIRFRELSCSVLVSEQEAEQRQDGAFLVQAFNSSRLFAFCERVFFSTPYTHGDVRVSASFHPSLQLRLGGEVVFRAEMRAADAAQKREPARSGEEGWEGPIFLPALRGKCRQGNAFFAKVCGHTQTYPFLSQQDSLVIKPSPRSAILQALIDSHLEAKEWAVRDDATHAKSKTYKRSEVLEFI